MIQKRVVIPVLIFLAVLVAWAVITSLPQTEESRAIVDIHAAQTTERVATGKVEGQSTSSTTSTQSIHP